MAGPLAQRPKPPGRIRRLAGLALIALLALALRCPRLGQRPLHNDEAVNGLKFGQLWDARVARLYGPYQYDPREYHGPSLPYATAALAWLTRAPDLDHFSAARLRVLALLPGLGLVLFLPLLGGALDRRALLWAALFTAL